VFAFARDRPLIEGPAGQAGFSATARRCSSNAYECLAIDVAGSIRSGRVIDVLTRLVSLHGAPQYLRSDNGPQFVALALLRWIQEAGLDPTFIDPGKPSTEWHG
jgi:transposase InsO family protein